jgi:hypothetical protein
LAEGRRVSVRLSAARFFDAGQAALRFAGERRFRDDWELSSSRAAAVVSYMQSAHGIDGRNLSAAGYGRTRPLAPDPGSPDVDRNRRIDLVLDVAGTDLQSLVPAAP